VYTFPAGKSLWHGTTANFSDKAEDRQWYQNVLNNNIEAALSRPIYLSDATTVKMYGTDMDSSQLVSVCTEFTRPGNDRIKSSAVVPLYWIPGPHGVNIEFKLKAKLTLLDIGNYKNLMKLVKRINGLDIPDGASAEDADEDAEGKIDKEHIIDILNTTCLESKYTVIKAKNKGDRNKVVSFKPRFCNRQSKTWSDENLVKYLMCNEKMRELLQMNDIDGWIYFGKEFGTNGSTFHGEVLLCKPASKLEYRSISTVQDTIYHGIPTYKEFMSYMPKYTKAMAKGNNVLLRKGYNMIVEFPERESPMKLRRYTAGSIR
jgi:hypothetical protein